MVFHRGPHRDCSRDVDSRRRGGPSGRVRGCGGHESPVALRLLRHCFDPHVRVRRHRRTRAAVSRQTERGDQPVPRASAHRIRLHRVTLGGVLHGHGRSCVAAASHPIPGSLGGRSITSALFPEALARHPEVSPGGRGDGGVCDDARNAHCILHNQASVRNCVSRRIVRDHDTIHDRPFPAKSAARRASGSRCSPSATSRST